MVRSCIVATLLATLQVVGGIRPTWAHWEQAVKEFQQLGYHAFSCQPEAEVDPDAEFVPDDVACLGLGCFQGTIVLAGLGLWIAGHPRDARLAFSGLELNLSFTPDQSTLEPLGRLVMRAGISPDNLESMRSASEVTVTRDDVGPVQFSMENYSSALARVRQLCR